MQRMDGPHIEEVFDSPRRSETRQSDRQWRIGRIQDLVHNPETGQSKDLLKEVLDLLKEHRQDYEDEQDIDGVDHRQTIAKLTDKIDMYTPCYYRAVDDYNMRKEESRREEARRAVSFGNSQHNITGRDNRSKLYQSSQRNYSSEDEENDEYVSRSHTRHADSRYESQDRDRDTRDYQSSSSQAHHHHHHQRDDSRRHQTSSFPKQPRMRAGKSRVTKTNSRKWRPGQKALAEIRKYQKTSDLLIQKAPFYRVVQEILRETSGFTNDHRIRADAIAALQEAAEAFLVEMFEGSALLSLHAKRVTLMPSDIQLYRRLCLRNF